MFPKLHAYLGNVHVQDCWHIADSNFAVFDQFSDGYGIGDIDFAKSTSNLIVSVDNFFCIGHDVTSNMNQILGLETHYFRSL